MSIKEEAFKRVSPGLKWDRRRGLALFDVVKGRGKGRVRVRRILPFDSVEDAKHAFPTFRADVKEGRYDQLAAPDAELPSPIVSPDQPQPTLAAYVEAHWESLHARCGESTAQTNRTSYKNHVQPFFGEKPLAAIEEADCEDFAAQMKAAGKSPYTTNLALRFVRKVLHHARRRKVRPDVPEDFHFAKEPLLTLEMNDLEQDRFFAAFDDEEGFREHLRQSQRKGKVVKSARFGFKERRFGGGLKADSDAAAVYFRRYQRSKLIFTAAVDLGYRVTDLRLLKRSAVDLKRGVAAITTRKTGKSAVVALSDRCRAAVEEAMSCAVANAEYVFTTDEGHRYPEATLRRYFALAKQLAGIIRRCRLNDLRHTFASNLASEGLSLLDIRDALGHTTARMSERYAKPNAHAVERMRQALNARQQRVSGATRSDTHAQKSEQ